MRIYERKDRLMWCSDAVERSWLGSKWSDLGLFVNLGAHPLCHPSGAPFPGLECRCRPGCQPPWSLGGKTFGISSLPTCLPRRGGAGFLVLCLVLLHFRVWLRTSPCLCQLGIPNLFLLQILCHFELLNRECLICLAPLHSLLNCTRSQTRSVNTNRGLC